MYVRYIKEKEHIFGTFVLYLADAEAKISSFFDQQTVYCMKIHNLQIKSTFREE